MRDLAQTVQVLARFGPKLPQMVEALLIRQTEEAEPPRGQSWLKTGGLVGLGGVLMLLVVLVSAQF